MLWQEKMHFFYNQFKERPKCKNCKSEDCHFMDSAHVYSKYCRTCCKENPWMNGNYSSSPEIEIKEYIVSLLPKNTIVEKKYIGGHELDIFIPSMNLAFEHNGLYYHDEYVRDHKYHFDKWKMCKEHGIKLMNIWGDDWYYKKKIVKSMIENKLKKCVNKIYARECTIKNVSSKDSRDFLDKNHIQGKIDSSIRLGLYFKNRLVSLMTFGKQRFGKDKDNVCELYRFCSEINMIVIGGASKLFSHFIKIYRPIKIESYANLDFSNGNVYEILGFKSTNNITINYWWWNNNKRNLEEYVKRENRGRYNKTNLIKEGFDYNMSENMIMYNRGYKKIYGVGVLKYVWINKKEG